MKDSQEYYAGVDIGSAFIKAVLVSHKQIMVSRIVASGGNYKETARKVLDEALSEAGVSFEELSGIVVTGIGAESAPFQARQVSDVSCQAVGCRFLFPSARIVIDIGGQFTKWILVSPPSACLGDPGSVEDFALNGLCAAGSGASHRALCVRRSGMRVPSGRQAPVRP